MARKPKIKQLKEEPKKQVVSKPEPIEPKVELETEVPPKPEMRRTKKGGRWIWV